MNECQHVHVLGWTCLRLAGHDEPHFDGYHTWTSDEDDTLVRGSE